jgi:cell division protein FtsB
MAIILKKASWWRILESKFILGVLLVIILGLGISVYDRFVIEREMAGRRAEKEKELTNLKERKQVLEEKVNYLSNDRGVEAEIRKHFDVAREGEQVVVLLEDERNLDEILSTSTQNSQVANSFWSSLIPW